MVSFDDTSKRDHRNPLSETLASSNCFAGAADSLRRAALWLKEQQAPEGYWCGELEGDSILQSEYLLLLAWLGRERTEVAGKCARRLLRQQLPDGGWGMYPGGGLEISGSVKAYFALKLAGIDPQSPAMERARRAIRAHGGADAVNSFTRFYLALLGQISYDHCPAVPPEMLLLPDWSPFNIYRLSAWSRTIFVPLSLVWAHRPVRMLDESQGIAELFLQPPASWPALRSPGRKASARAWAWEKFFRVVDGGLKIIEKLGWHPLRRPAVRAAEHWMLQRFEKSDGLGAIFPPIIWSAIALRCLGYDDQSDEARYCDRQLGELMIEDAETIRLQPCKSPVWDTAISIRGLAAAGSSISDQASQRAVDWLLEKEVRVKGDWSHTVSAEPGGWYFEHANEYYPDVDDTIMVLMALHDQAQGHLQVKASRWSAAGSIWSAPTGPAAEGDSLSFLLHETHHTVQKVHEYLRRMERVTAACQRGVAWTLAMQNSDGGWGAFDRNNDYEFLCHVPFADHNAMIDPSTPDITGRVLEMLGKFGFTRYHDAVLRAVNYVRATQEDDGSWYGRWGVNYVYGTWQVLVGLAGVGVSKTDPAIARGSDWLLKHQQANGGWGESADSYARPELRGQGPVTASQTAWALLGLLAAGQQHHPAVLRGIRYLVDSQRADGSWHEPQFTGTGFPLVFYLRYHLYPQYFPLLALGQWEKAVRE